MEDERDLGYSKEEYHQISAKQNLPVRCPILGKCRRAFQTRHEIGFRMSGVKVTFENFLYQQGFECNPDELIKPIEQLDWRHSHDVISSVESVCPEVTLFEPQYMPFNFKQSAYGSASYRKETRKFTAVPRHYSECAEFSEYAFHSGEFKPKNQKTSNSRKRSHISRTMKFEIYQRDEFRCYYCKKHKSQLPEGVHLSLDHKIPYVDGGDDSFENLVTACSECNNGKANKVINNL